MKSVFCIYSILYIIEGIYLNTQLMLIQRHAFTLVELIVAITLIAILGTIAFISLVRSNADARDAIRLSDTKSLARLVALQINGEKI